MVQAGVLDPLNGSSRALPSRPETLIKHACTVIADGQEVLVVFTKFQELGTTNGVIAVSLPSSSPALLVLGRTSGASLSPVSDTRH